MARTQRNKQLRPLHLFICEDSKSSKYYMQGLGRAKGINIKAEEADGTSPENVLRSAKEKQKLFKDKKSYKFIVFLIKMIVMMKSLRKLSLNVRRLVS